jgi:hypothetical protein
MFVSTLSTELLAKMELQAYWDAVGQKYTGCDFYQSALHSTKKIL